MDSIANKTWLRISFFYLLVVAILGIFLRAAFVFELPDWFYYRNITHSHSHVAMLGWIYNLLFVLIVYLFELSKKGYKNLFWITQVAVIGMLLSFPVQGYGIFSIAFTSLHIFCAYAFVIMVVRDMKVKSHNISNMASLYLKTALIMLFLSTLGTWALAIFMKTGMKGSVLYYAVIQFFLHFQFNGWFVFGILAILFQFMGLKQIRVDKDLNRKLYAFLLFSCVLTYALAITWSTPDKFIFWTNSLGVILQLVALYFLIKIMKEATKQLVSNAKSWTVMLIFLSFMCLFIKILVQGFVAIPYLATVSYTIKNFVIGFIHLMNLGFVSLFFFAMIFQFSKLNSGLFTKGSKVFLFGFLSTELILFLQGIMLWFKLGFMPYYYQIILAFSLFLLLGVMIMFISLFNKGDSNLAKGNNK